VVVHDRFGRRWHHPSGHAIVISETLNQSEETCVPIARGI